MVEFISDQLSLYKDFRFLNTLKCASICADTEELQQSILAYAQSQIERTDEYGPRIGGQLLRGLLKSGFFPDGSFIHFLCAHPIALKSSAHQLFLAIERSYNESWASEILFELTQSVLFEAKFVRATIALSDPLPFLISSVALLSVVSEWRSAVRVSLTTVSDLFSLVIKSALLRRDGPPQLAAFFLDLSKEQLATVSPSDVTAFIRRIGELNPTQGIYTV
jgi:hypothetical protein